MNCPAKIVLADPPWNWKARSEKGAGRSPKYECMDLPEICALPVREIVAKDAILFLWVTGPLLERGFQVIRAWGFEYKTIGFTWAKLTRRAYQNYLRLQQAGAPFQEIMARLWAIGGGYYTRANAELCLIATRGKNYPKRINAGVRQLIISPLEAHSKKPERVHDDIITLLGDITPRVELFARRPREGWICFGNEVNDGADIRVMLQRYREGISGSRIVLQKPIVASKKLIKNAN